jgi:alpha-1,6-mannosyltransferase
VATKIVNSKPGWLARWGVPSLLAGVAIETCFAALLPLSQLCGPAATTFLAYFLMAAGAYAVAVACLGRDRLSLRAIWAFAILFRLTLLLTSPPTLSDDVYRYIWDGRLANAGVNPYAYAVESSLLDPFDSPQRALVNNSWMASPYLPTAQGLFAAVYRLAPDSPLAFQIAALLFDLLTGWLIMDILDRLGLPRARVLIYLWNPLVVVEFAHGAHVDALMICLVMATFWFLVAARSEHRRARWFTLGSVIALAAGTLTKGLPALLLPVVVRRWGWRRTLIYIGLIVGVCLPFALGAGWGLTGPLDGEGLFGAIRIYTAYWNYNGGLYHWLEVGLSGYRTPGAVPLELVGWGPTRAAKLILGGVLGLILVAVWWKAQGGEADHPGQSLALLRLAAIPLAAYLLLATTLHPWYVTLIIPLLPFLLPQKGEATTSGRFLWPWLYFSAAVLLSYLTCLDPANPREYHLIRHIEYIPLYLLLIWAAFHAYCFPCQNGQNGQSSPSG